MIHPTLTVHLETISAFCERNAVRELALFGSVTRADFRPDSDVDVLVEFKPEAKVGFMALSRMQRELSDLFHRPVDLVPKKGLKPVIELQIMQERQILYAA
ncbi:MAG: nucleotidyltransferase family protein [Gammaproteobacteria bacterium]